MPSIEDNPGSCWIQPASTAPPVLDSASATPAITPVRTPSSAKTLLGNACDDGESSFLEERSAKGKVKKTANEQLLTETTAPERKKSTFSDSSADTNASTRAIPDQERVLEALNEADSDDEYLDSLEGLAAGESQH